MEIRLVCEVELTVGSGQPVQQHCPILARNLRLTLQKVRVQFVLLLGLKKIGIYLLDVRGAGLDIVQISLVYWEHVFRIRGHELLNRVHFLNYEKEWEYNV